MTVLLFLNTGTMIAHAEYETEAEAVEQALHDMELGAREIQEIKDQEGNVLWSRDQLKAALADRIARG